MPARTTAAILLNHVAVPTTVEIAALTVRLEDDPTLRGALEHGYSFYQAAVAAGVVEDGEIAAFALAVGHTVKEGLIGYRREAGGVEIPEGPWTDHVLQSRFDYHSTVDGQHATSLLAQRQPQEDGSDKAVEKTRWLVNYVFALPDMRGFPALEDLADDEIRILRQYVRQADRLVGSSALQKGTRYTVSIDFLDEALPEGSRAEQAGGRPAEVSVETDWPADDALAGLAVQFRHLYADERASFARAMGVLQQALRRNGHNDGTSPELAMLAAYGHAVGKLRQEWLRQLAHEKGQERGLIPRFIKRASSVPDDGPEAVLSIYFYGEHIHWGDRADEVAEIAENPLRDAQYRMAFLEAISALAVVYADFAELIKRALTGDAP